MGGVQNGVRLGFKRACPAVRKITGRCHDMISAHCKGPVSPHAFGYLDKATIAPLKESGTRCTVSIFAALICGISLYFSRLSPRRMPDVAEHA